MFFIETGGHPSRAGNVYIYHSLLFRVVSGCAGIFPFESVCGSCIDKFNAWFTCGCVWVMYRLASVIILNGSLTTCTYHHVNIEIHKR